MIGQILLVSSASDAVAANASPKAVANNLENTFIDCFSLVFFLLGLFDQCLSRQEIKPEQAAVMMHPLAGK